MEIQMHIKIHSYSYTVDYRYICNLMHVSHMETYIFQTERQKDRRQVTRGKHTINGNDYYNHPRYPKCSNLFPKKKIKQR